MSTDGVLAIDLLAGPFDTAPETPPGMDNIKVAIGYAAWIAVAVATIGVLLAGWALAQNDEGAHQEARGKLGAAIVGCIIIGGAGVFAGNLMGVNLFTSTPRAIPGLTKVQSIVHWAAFAAAAGAFVALLWVGATFWRSHRRGGIQEHAERLGHVIAGMVVIGSGGTLVGLFT
jgi:cytochrome b561